MNHTYSQVLDMNPFAKQTNNPWQVQIAALNAAANAVLILDDTGIIIWVNSAFTTLTGYSEADVLGKHPSKVFRSGVHDPAFYEEHLNALRAGRVWHGRITNKRKDGSLYTEEQTITPVFDETGRITHYIAVKQDVTELEEQQAEIKRQNAELIRFNEMKNKFLGIAAHDLRNPISHIHMTVEFMRDPVSALSDEERELLLNHIVRQTDHMLNLINNLLDISKIEADKMVLAHEVIEMQTFIGDLVTHHAQLAAQKGTQVELETAAEGELFADPTRLRQVMDNLISNAVKFSPPGSTVWVTSDRDDRGWLIRVRDEGPGIDPQEREHLFTDFARLSARPTGDESSTGLGLAITKRIVEAHNGEVGVDSEYGQGATFWVRLPHTDTCNPN